MKYSNVIYRIEYGILGGAARPRAPPIKAMRQ